MQVERFAALEMVLSFKGLNYEINAASENQGKYQVMANIYYKDRLIIAYASLSQSTKLWNPGAEITWKHDGQRCSHTIGGLQDRFKTSEEAEKFVINIAKTWIDASA
jgi:hypothetical protein